jgi:hypothetical protein
MKALKLSLPLILIVSALLPSGVSRGDEKHQNQTQKHNHSTTDQAHTSPCPTPFQIVVEPAPVKIVQASAAIEQNKPRQKWYQRPTITDWGILGVTLLYTVISLGLLAATKGALREATESANAAVKSARTTELAFYTSSRPWVIVSDFIITPGRMIYYKVYNAGPTPALIIGISIHSKTSEITPDTDWLEPSIEVTQRIAIPIPPHTSRTDGFTFKMFKPEIAKTDWERIANNEKFLYCYGFIRYIGPLNKDWFYDTGFGAWHQGTLHLAKGHPMEPLTGHKINFFR